MSDEPKEKESHAGTDSHAADAHGHGAHGHDDHGHDDGGHGHGHDVPADAIKEGSAYDAVLSTLALVVGVALVGLIVYWCSLKPAVVAEGEPGSEHAAEHQSAPNSEPAAVH